MGIKPERVQTLCRPDYVVHEWEGLFLVLRRLTLDGYADLDEPDAAAAWR